MKRLLASIFAAIAFMFIVAAPASAQSRTWVSGVGDDLNPCSRTAPCKTFAGAISKTAAGGEINCLDPGGFGAVTIAKSITIDCSNTMGGILSSNTTGILVNAAGIVVTIRGVAIDAAGTTTGNGIRILQAGAVTIDNVVIENLGGTTATNGRGVTIETATANTRVAIKNSRFVNVNSFGVHSNPSAGNVLLTIDNTSFSRGGSTGIQLRQLTAATISRTSIDGSPAGTAGITLELSTVTAMISNSILSNNGIGIFNGNGGSPITRLYGSTITGSLSQGLQINTGQVISMGNNVIQGNAGNQTPSSTIPTN